jgi:hypothetical protein
MTQPQAEAIARALHRAHARGLLVTGKGSRKSDGALVYAVTSSSQPGRWHLVAVMGSRLACDCQAGKRGLVCQHRALVHERILAERAALRATTPAIAALRAHFGGRSQAPFSLMK